MAENCPEVMKDKHPQIQETIPSEINKTKYRYLSKPAECQNL